MNAPDRKWNGNGNQCCPVASDTQTANTVLVLVSTARLNMNENLNDSMH